MDFGDAPVRVEIYSSEETVEIFIEADLRRFRRSVGALPFSTFPATSLAKPPVQRPDAPWHPHDPNAEERSTSCVRATTSNDVAGKYYMPSGTPYKPNNNRSAGGKDLKG